MSTPSDIDYEAIASYLPRAFCIELSSTIFESPAPGIENLTFSAQSLPVFMHEVAHFIQDRSTFRGVIDFMDMWDRVSAVSGHIRSCNHRVELPLVDFESGSTRLRSDLQWAIETDFLRRLREPRFSWDSEERYWTYQSHEVVLISTEMAGRELTIPTVNVEFVDNASGETYSHELGAWEIKEAYSVAVALLHGGELPRFGTNAFEYLAVERIVSWFFGEVTPRQIVAICHWCLQDLAPGNTFFSIVEHFQQHGGLPGDLEIYEYARTDALNRGFADNCRDVIGNVEAYARNLGTQDQTLGELFRWYHEHAEALLAIQVDPARHFPLDTPLCDEGIQLDGVRQSDGFHRLFAEVEVPLIVWPDGQFYSISTERQLASSVVFFNRAVGDCLTRLWTSQQPKWKCPLHSGCTLEMKDNSVCLSEPWKKTRLTITCPYGAAAKVLSIDEHVELVATPFR